MSHPLLSPGRMIDIVDSSWKSATLPNDHIRVPVDELPDPDSDNGTLETLRELERKWTDLALQRIELGKTASQIKPPFFRHLETL